MICLLENLGSTAYTINGTTAPNRHPGETRYFPWGKDRFTSGQTLTSYKFTGQREEAGLGLYYYGARWYDPALGRFIQPDTIVPNPGDVQSFDRYAYTLNNPLRYNDPTGHVGNDVAIHDSNDGPAASWQKWMALYDTDLDQLQGEILAWLQDHQADYRQIALVHKTLTSYAEAMGGAAVLMTFESVYANAYMGGELPALWDHPGAEQLANSILAPVAGASMADTMLGYRAMGPGVPCSFAANTLVATADGLKPITEVEEGDLVYAYNEATGEVGLYPVTAELAHLDREIVTLVINGERIVTTPEHPFYTLVNSWTPAGALQVGDEIRRANGDVGIVQTITVAERPQVMYNLTVADAHTFFVGEGQWLVHNQCPFSITTLRANSQVPDKNGFTRAGRALQKHAGRAGSPWQPFKPSGTLNQPNYNNEADQLVQSLLTDPATTVTSRSHFRYGTIYDFRASDGRGLRYDGSGNFIGFLD